MSKVFVLDTKKRPLVPTHPARARQLLKKGKAAVYRRYPFTIILKYEISEPETQPLRLKIDPGSKRTGLAIVKDQTGEVVFAAEIQHRGEEIKKAMDSRRACRHSRRGRKTRYRKPRRNNRRRKEGWLSPTLSRKCGAKGRGSRRICSMDKYGFPRTKPKSTKTVYGFKTGDIVFAIVPKGKKAGGYIGRVLVRATGNFDIRTKAGRIQGINHRYCRIIQKNDGYNYQGGVPIPLHL